MQGSDAKKINIIPPVYQKRRFAIAWCVTGVALAAVIIACVFNYNAVMILFDRGNVRLGSYDNLSWKLRLSPDKYQLLEGYIGEEESPSSVVFKTTDGLALLDVRISNERIYQVNGTIYTKELSGIDAVNYLTAINDILSPVIYPRDILALELLVLQEAYKIPDLSSGVNISKDLGESAITLVSSKPESTITFIIRRK